MNIQLCTINYNAEVSDEEKYGQLFSTINSILDNESVCNIVATHRIIEFLSKTENFKEEKCDIIVKNYDKAGTYKNIITFKEKFPYNFERYKYYLKFYNSTELIARIDVDVI